MSRAALSMPPTYGAVADTRDAYLHSTQLRQLARQSGRFWSFHAAPTTVALSGNRYAKSLAGFTDHETEESFRELLREFSSHGCERPGGYADVFHSLYRSPRVPWSINALLAPCLAGGWQQAISPGRHKGTYYKYDMRSAYLWAAGLGMPDTRTYTRSLIPHAKADGVYRIRLIEPCITAPFPFNQCYECIASNLEIETYGLRISSVVDGVTWRNTTSGEEIIETVRKVSTWKQAGRAYWGRWGQMQKLTCTANGKEWQLPNMALNIPWAHSIISRVKMRLWEHAKHALHVYVDSVITSDRLPTGDGLGDWRLEKTYDGVFIRGPGQYGALNEPRLERMAGFSLDSPRRQHPVDSGEVAPFTVHRKPNNAKGKNSHADEWIF